MKKLYLGLLFSITLCQVLAQGSWQLKKNENGISTYTRTPASGNLKELRVVCEFDATKAQLIATLQDIDHYKDWVYSSKKSEILKTPSPQKTIYYSQSHLPWPIKDRDLIIELDIGPPEADVLYIQAKSLPAYLPKNDKFVRVPYSLATWKVTQAPEGKLKIDYTFSVDPGGSIPAWLVNATLAIGPYNSFVKLKEVLKQAKHK